MAKGKHYRTKNSAPHQPRTELNESLYTYTATAQPEENTRVVNTNEDLHQAVPYTAERTPNPPMPQYQSPVQQYPQQPKRKKKSIVPPLLAGLFLLAALGIVIYMLWSMDIFSMLPAFFG